ncbi:type II toxin-antitoxin system RelE/ParE family toxin [Silanimonas sp.]|uniref:type II toxin-antitoxin system RelE/ParE family toxin n=1 Tax=Silanimonas sp. TaxID=1929290 RepID=UPI0022BB6CB5|nr:type II toxin-antitoxin system RelE/ParE family toxin [Silanimonas sp.]MCZ8061832.1 type II toxin-antitoxin system RelE/ParE family toxin [Silanimonas sp.]
MKLIYSARALADLDRLRVFIAEHSPGAALRIVNALIARIERLADFPAMGREVKTAAPLQVRHFAFDAYVVRYVPTAEALVILRVWHHRERR